jgi:hypothetical protein
MSLSWCKYTTDEGRCQYTVTDQPAPDPCVARNCDSAAVQGLLCGRDGQRLADHYGAREGHGQPGRLVHGLPWMYEHVRLAYPSLSGWTSGGGSSGVDDAEAEKLAAVLTLRTDIEDYLTETARDLASRICRHGPQLDEATPWARVYRSAAWLVVNIQPLRSGQGVQAAINGERTPDHEPEQNAADQAVRAVLVEADDLASRAHALAPWRAAPTKLDGIPCRCGAVGTLHDYGTDVVCWRCTRKYSPEEYATLCKVLAHRFRDQEGATA